MSDEDLFGSEDEGGVKETNVSSSGGNGPTGVGNDEVGDENLFGSDDDEPTGWVDAQESKEDKLAAILGQAGSTEAKEAEIKKPTRSKLFLEKTIPLPEDVSKLAYLKAPRFMKIQSNAYDKETFDPDMERAEYGALTSDVIRWRYKTDEAGNKVVDASGEPLMESNARLQKLKNGSYQVVVGKNVFDVSTEKMSKSYLFMSNVSTPPPAGSALTEAEEASGMTVNDSTNLTMAGTLDGAMRMIIQPRLDSKTHAHVNQAITKQYRKQDRMNVRDVRDILENPEMTLEKNEKEEKARLLSERKGRDPDRAGHAYGSREGRIGMSSDYLNEDQYDEINLSDIKRGVKEKKRGGRKRSQKARGRFGELDDEEADEGEDLDADEEDSDDQDGDDDDLEGFIVKGGDDDDDDDDDDGNNDDNDDTTKIMMATTIILSSGEHY
jgi:hypothetical protein